MKKKMLSVEKCLEVVEEAGAPVVIMAGGEPLIHPQINEMFEQVDNGRYRMKRHLGH